MKLSGDDQIVDGLKRGLRTSWLALHDAHAASLWRSVACQMPNDSVAVGDVVQETLMEAVRTIKNFRPEHGTLSRWLFGIARHRVARFYRAEARQNRIHELQEWWHEVGFEGPAWVLGDSETPEEVLAAAETGELIQLTLSALSDDHAFVLSARYLRGESAVEIARHMDSTPDAVRAMLMRARRAFRAVFLSLVNPDWENVEEVRDE